MSASTMGLREEVEAGAFSRVTGSSGSGAGSPVAIDKPKCHEAAAGTSYFSTRRTSTWCARRSFAMKSIHAILIFDDVLT